MDTAGIFVVRTRMVTLAGATDQGRTGYGAASSRPTAPMMNAFRGYRRDSFVNKTVIITGGPYKGYQGIAKSDTDKGVRVELHTNGKVVTVAREKVIEKEYVSETLLSCSLNTSVCRELNGNARRNNFSGVQTPMVGSKTPNVAVGAQTPSHLTSARTPAWDASARTPAWDASARTPAWDSGARTPAAFDASSRTPNVQRGDDLEDMRPEPESASGWEAEQPAEPELPGTVALVLTFSSSVVVLNLPPNWLIKDMCVIYLPKKQEAVVVNTSDGNSGSILINGKITQAVASELRPVPPSKRDPCVLLDGRHRGLVGVLKGYDLEDAIVKVDHPDIPDGLLLEHISNLCKNSSGAS
jgi:hypothetical protein